MMELTEAHIAFIKQDLLERGITLYDLADSFVDHICCTIESNPGQSFDEAYANALDAFGENGLNKIQQETILLLTFKKEITMKKTMFVLGYIAASLITTGLLFKLQHWAGAAVMLVTGIVLLNLGYLPMYFYNRYKQST